MEINWFPGHMAKALRDVKEGLKKVDMVIEICDARVPFSSRNPELDKILGTKPRILVLNKADLAEEAWTKQWIQTFEDMGIRTISLDGTNKAVMKKLKDACLALCADKITARDEQRPADPTDPHHGGRHSEHRQIHHHQHHVRAKDRHDVRSARCHKIRAMGPDG